MPTSQTSPTPTSNTPEFDMASFVSPTPLDTNAFDSYKVDITSEWETEDGCGFTGDVLLNGIAVFSFENDGEMGANKYLPHGVEGREALSDFKKLSTENFPDKFEPVDYALIYLEVRDGKENL